MNNRMKLEIIAALVAVTILCVVGYQWHASHEAAAVAQAESRVLQGKIDAAQKSIDAANDSIARRDQVLAQMQQQFAAQVASIRTPAQAQPIILDYANKNLPAGSVETQTDATGKTTYTLTPDAVVQLAKDVASCQEQGKELSTCQQDKADLQHETVDLASQRDSYRQDADTWKKAAKGGTTWQRVWRVTKYVGIGAAAGYVIAKR